MIESVTSRDDLDFARCHLGRKFPVGGDVSVLRVSSSRSGMTHRVKVLAPAESGGGVLNVSYYVATITGSRFDWCDGSVILRGAGMDMGAALVMSLSRALHGDDYALSHRNI
jgi:hypothetical protein